MQGEPFSGQGVDECWIDECRGRDVSRVEGGDAGLPKMLEDLAGRFRGMDKIRASRAAWIELGTLVLFDFCGSDARQDRLL